ncbi:MAG: Eco57I restriction-modification methylase domain-containing protein [Muribaculaceae bacterium]
MENLILKHKDSFNNLGEYEILNISGFDRKNFKKAEDIKNKISKCEAEGRKTITLTVNRMLTGSTVPEWDTMLFLKSSSSPEEYDQAAFRLQNPFIVDYYFSKEKIIRLNKKPQTILVDFEPERMFRLQERKSQIFNFNSDKNGNSKLAERIKKELKISPIITLDCNKLRQVQASDIIDAVRRYAETRSVLEEAQEIPVDLTLLDNPEIKKIIQDLNPIDSNKGIKIPVNKPVEGTDGDNLNPENKGDKQGGDNNGNAGNKEKNDDTLAKKFAAYYSLILFFAFITDNKVSSLEDIIKVIDANANNKRIKEHLGLNKDILILFQKKLNGFALSKLDYKIHNTNSLNSDENKEPMKRVEVALTKFSRMSESEIVTPAKVADDVVAILPDDVANGGNILDIASKQGEFTAALIRRFGIDIGKNIYSVCTSGLAYEFTRKVYKLLSLPTNHIYDSFTSYDLIKQTKKSTKNKVEFDIEKINKMLNNIKFKAVVGNPPYQVNDGSGASDDAANPVYQHFVNISSIINPLYFSLIMPSKWMIGGKVVLKPFRKEMMNDTHISKFYDMEDSAYCFRNQHIDGGICYFLWNKKHCGELMYNYRPANSDPFTSYRLLNDGISDIIIRDSRRQSIIEKVTNNIKLLKEIISLTQPYGIRKDLFNSPERYPTANLQFSPFPGCTKVYGVKGIKGGARRTIGFVNPSVITKNQQWIDAYKLFFTTSYSTNAINPPEAIIGERNSACTETFLNIGPFKTETEQANCKKYFDTNFFKILLFFGRGTMQVSQEVFRFVPLQDFTENSDIDWSKSVAEIDAQLYKKYNLSEDEISFIESMIKPM